MAKGEKQTFTFDEIKQAMNNGENITKSQSGKEAYEAILKKFPVIEPGDRFYHKCLGRWNKKRVDSPKEEINKPQCVKAPINTKIPDVRPPGTIELIPEIKGGFNRKWDGKKKIEVYSIEAVMRCTDKSIIGFLPVYENGVKLS